MRSFPSKTIRLFGAGLFLLIAPLASDAIANEPARDFTAVQIEFFEKEIRPVLAEYCLDCHTGTKAKVGLQLNRRDGWLKGSDYRPIIDLENPEESLVVRSLQQVDDKDVPAMPEKGDKIPGPAIAALTEWIRQGLPWPAKGSGDETIDPANHWSFKPVAPETLPEDAGHPIDYFIRRAQEAKGLTPAPRADRATRYRRASFSLLGLPPKYEEQNQFLKDDRSDEESWGAVVDALLDSPHYGERFARHWMDVARYADTKGYEVGGRERRFVHSYTYRDWLIRAFNEDMPYDRFLLYQLAGEQLVDWEKPERKHLAALGFLSLSKSGGAQELVLDDRLDTTFRGTMALTVSCARCHDHKFDPISIKEYYSLYGVFANSQIKDEPTIGSPPSGPEWKEYLAEKAAKQKAVDDYLNPILDRLAEENPDIGKRPLQLLPKLTIEEKAQRDKLQRAHDTFVIDSEMEPDKAIILKDNPRPAQQAVFVRGNPSRRGDIVPPQFLAIASPETPQPFQNGSGRLEMAQALATPDNPLTARNIVNRIWLWHFGEGIVRTIDDFGIQGEKPDHPELLDWLANWLVENDWSIKKLNRLILTSQTWQQASQNEHYDANQLIDPENRLLWQSPRHRLDLEQMRDSILAVSGTLDDTLYGRAVKILEPPYSNRRSVYAFIDRQNLNPVFRNFDFSNPQETTGQRPTTTIPMQALFTLNSDFVQDQASSFAKSSESADDRLTHLHRAAFAADPSNTDRQLADSFVTAYQSEIDSLARRQTDSDWSYGYGQVNDATGEVTFTPFEHWTGKRWQVQQDFPVSNQPTGYLYRDHRGGHPGHNSAHSNIVRWVAPADLTLRISGPVERKSPQGNGIRFKVVSSEEGVLLNKLLPAKAERNRSDIPEVTITKGEQLYFIVEPHENNYNSDSFSWNVILTNLGERYSKWDLEKSFAGPSRTADAWSAYAHALLNTNRFLFID